MFGSISGWFRRWLGGIQIAEDAVGADRIVIRPQVVGSLSYVKYSHRTIRGLIQSNWRKGEGKTEFEIVIPPDTTATIELPIREGETFTEGGKPLEESEGVVRLSPSSKTFKLQVGSGTYRLQRKSP
jgi:alpha-L-rhamnosidase